jgi:hypothetical protein
MNGGIALDTRSWREDTHKLIIRIAQKMGGNNLISHADRCKHSIPLLVLALPKTHDAVPATTVTSVDGAAAAQVATPTV